MHFGFYIWVKADIITLLHLQNIAIQTIEKNEPLQTQNIHNNFGNEKGKVFISVNNSNTALQWMIIFQWLCYVSEPWSSLHSDKMKEKRRCATRGILLCWWHKCQNPSWHPSITVARFFRSHTNISGLTWKIVNATKRLLQLNLFLLSPKVLFRHFVAWGLWWCWQQRSMLHTELWSPPGFAFVTLALLHQ